jgi:2'-5' RNA ligase superfamily protein
VRIGCLPTASGIVITMPYGVVLLPDARTARALTELSHAIGHGARPLHQLGDHAPPHVSVLHLDVPDERAAEIAARVRPVRITVKVIGLLYVPVPAGDHYVPTGGTYFGVEVVRRPDLDALHHEYLDFAAARGMTPLGAVGDDYRPHVTLGVTEVQPALPPLDMVPLGELTMTLAGGPIGPYGTFPTLGPSGAGHRPDA